MIKLAINENNIKKSIRLFFKKRCRHYNKRVLKIGRWKHLFIICLKHTIDKTFLNSNNYFIYFLSSKFNST
jgi:hypothetical protein